jgi:hypothetical protein
MLIEKKTQFIVWAESATIRPRGTMTKARRAALAEDEARFGRRRDRSRRSLRRTLARAAALVSSEDVLFETDKKSSYVELAREAFGRDGWCTRGRAASSREPSRTRSSRSITPRRWRGT